MKFNMTLRIKLFLVIICVIISAQMIYSKNNIDTFRRSYIQALHDKCLKAGAVVKADVEYVLNLGIPLAKLIKLEKTLKQVLDAVPELAFIEIADLDGQVLYYADHQSMKRTGAGARPSAVLESRSTPGRTDTVLPVYCRRDNRQVGTINMRLSSKIIAAKSREIMIDLITVILVSLLLTFEALSFFVEHSISGPMARGTQALCHAMARSSRLTGENMGSLKELGQLAAGFNRFMDHYLKCLAPTMFVRQHLPDIREKIGRSIRHQAIAVDTLLETSDAGAMPSGMGKTLARIRCDLRRCEKGMDALVHRFSLKSPMAGPVDPSDPCDPRDAVIPVFHIRPLIFLFLVADGFCASFLPMYIESLYQPFFGLTRQVAVGLPISVYMIFLALSMPLAGAWSDAAGWRKPLMIGLLLNAAGLALTAVSRDLLQLVFFRSITAVGFGVVFMAGQRFIIDNTTMGTRALGMAAFLAAFFSGDICGTVTGGMLADRMGYRAIFFLSGMISFSALVYAAMVFKKQTPSAGKMTFSLPFSRKDLLLAIRDREFSAMVLLQAIPAKLILIGFLFYFVPFYLMELGVRQADIGRVIMCYGLTLVFFGPLFSKYVDRESNRKYFIFAGGMLTGLAMLSFWFFSGFNTILFIAFMLGIAHTISVSAQSSLVTRTAVVRKIGAGAGMGLFRFWERIGNVTGPLLVGGLMAAVGFRGTVIGIGVMSILSSMVYLFLVVFRKC